MAEGVTTIVVIGASRDLARHTTERMSRWTRDVRQDFPDGR